MKRLMQNFAILLMALVLFACGGKASKEDIPNNNPVVPPLEEKVESQSLGEKFQCSEDGLKVVNLLDVNDPQKIDFDPKLNKSLYQQLRRRHKGSLTDLAVISLNNRKYIARNVTIYKDPKQQAFVPPNIQVIIPQPNNQVPNIIDGALLGEGTGLVEVAKDDIDYNTLKIDLKCPVRELRFEKDIPNVGLGLYAATDCGVYLLSVSDAGLKIVKHYFEHRAITSTATGPGSVIYASTLAGEVYKWMPEAPNCDFLIYDPSLPKFKNTHSGEAERAFKLRSTNDDLIFMTKAFGGDTFNIQLLSDIFFKIVQRKYYHFDCTLYKFPHSGKTAVKQFELKQVGSGFYYCNDFDITPDQQIVMGMKVFDYKDVNKVYQSEVNKESPFQNYLKSIFNAWDGLVFFDTKGNLVDKITIPKVTLKDLVDKLIVKIQENNPNLDLTFLKDPQFQPLLQSSFPNLGLYFMPAVVSVNDPNAKCNYVLRGLWGYACFKDKQVSFTNYLDGAKLVDFDYVQNFVYDQDNLYEVGIFSNYRHVNFNEQKSVTLSNAYSNIWEPMTSAAEGHLVSMFDPEIQVVDGVNVSKISDEEDIKIDGNFYDRMGFPLQVRLQDKNYLLSLYEDAAEGVVALFDMEYKPITSLAFKFGFNPSGSFGFARPLAIVDNIVLTSVGHMNPANQAGEQSIHVFKIDANQGAPQLTAYQLQKDKSSVVENIPMFIAGAINLGNNQYALYEYSMSSLDKAAVLQKVTVELNNDTQTYSIVSIQQAPIGGIMFNLQGSMRVSGDKLVVLKNDFSLDIYDANLQLVKNSGALVPNYKVGVDFFGALSEQAKGQGQPGVIDLSGGGVEFLSGFVGLFNVVGDKAFVNAMEFSKIDGQVRSVVPRLASYDISSGEIQNYPDMEFTSVFPCYEDNKLSICATGLLQGYQVFDL